ncbi:type III secretion system export apparatus subunit SctV [Succinatimonas hippei]|uniref:Type III secretion protein, HrcV family n=1 Tax=Succinatimonas hippei (strain DSM 22608 / JCM 16073 / KCTC 15190 / YIT 12066) TaxID=762983 RepID=E8LIT2_SUCHY|nr:type III secretion system export apparatus subunit SctV [Succinatimonas hippei]EFY07556.1 type III secretion protein, HrcV family [Succinatimonas hippei YIT 12066]
MTLLDSARTASSLVTKHADFLLVGMVVAVICLMVVPLPTPLVDLLISANISMSFVILMMTMYAPNVLSFSSFPTLLLFTTLFRVGLNIATTRLILLQADAGEIIFTFGEFAVGGNFIVGAVVFIIIAIVQFLVISKGAERVSEVGARFSLDAMPGKQMSIDADLRAGSIDSEEAQNRRNAVSLESQMYGAMDGAMKFVKGDAIAGLLIAAVNIVAGTIIGVTQMGMTSGEALQLYGVLTVGDGLVSQIPSLLIAISAGILVTRSGGDNDNVGEQIGDQVFSQPKALKIAGTLVFLFALIPGFPKPQLFSLAFILFAIGYALSYMQKNKDLKVDPKVEIQKTLRSATDKRKAFSKEAGSEEFAPVVPLILDLSNNLSDSLDFSALNDELAALRRALYFDLGVPFPGVNLRENPNLEPYEYVLNLDEIPVAHGKLEPGCVMVREDPDNIRMLGVEVKEGRPFLPSEKTWWIKEEDKDKLKTIGVSYYTHSKVISLNLSLVLARHASDFIGLQEAKYLLDKMEDRAPDLVHEVSRLLPLQKIADLFKRLVQEQISIRDLRSILEAIIIWAPKEKDQVMLCEYIRSCLKRQISYKYCAGQNILPAILLEPSVEELIRKSIRQTSSGAFLALDPQSSRRFLKEVGRALGKRNRNLVIIASIDIRRYVRRLIETEFYNVPVLDYQELTPEISVQPIDRVRM